MAKKESGTFEKKLDRLEDIVGKLEGEGESLENSLKLFEEGVKLSQELGDSLKDVKLKVEILKKDIQGRASSEPWDESAQQ
ncbi:MAG TPA: exodeoxyribonuclease VII small subunit [Elusimicrobiales bacterium]|nr:exodeoxyribonuclease VII small subunit [Elusimicrobiales bacterium]